MEQLLTESRFPYCGSSFVTNTNSITAGTRKKLETWKKYIGYMIQGLPVRKTAEICGIHRNTAFIWRHKILDALQNYLDMKSWKVL